MGVTKTSRIGARHAAIRQDIIERLIAENPGQRGWDLYTIFLRDDEGKKWPTSCIWNDLNKMLLAGRLRTEIGARRARHYYVNHPTETPCTPTTNETSASFSHTSSPKPTSESSSTISSSPSATA